MRVRDALEGLLATDDEGAAGADSSDDADRTVIYECRNCGTAVTSSAAACPTCGAEEIATYAID